MQRLLLVIQHSDGYTYDFESTQPIIFSSVEELLITIEDKTQQYILDSQLFDKQREKFDISIQRFSKALTDCSHKIALAQDGSSEYLKLKQKRPILLKEFMAEREKFNEFFEENFPKPTFDLGGVQLHFSAFIENNHSIKNNKDTITFKAPCAYTLDEYFESVEAQAQMKNSIENGMDMDTGSNDNKVNKDKVVKRKL